jgi:hypothetical protein
LGTLTEELAEKKNFVGMIEAKGEEMSQEPNKNGFSLNDMDERELINFWDLISAQIDEIEMSDEIEDELKEVREEAKNLLDNVVKAYYK